MNKHDSKHQASSLVKAAVFSTDISNLLKTIPEPIGQLIVLVPADLDTGAASRRIWELAIATGSCVQLLSLCKDRAQEPSLRRQLLIIVALLADSGISTQPKVEMGSNWVDVVKRNYQTGDIIVCFAEQRAGFLHKALKQVMKARLDAPVFIFSNLSPRNLARLNIFSRILLWSGFISIMAGAFLLQIRITSLPHDWPQTTLLILSIIAEFSLIWVWNDWFS